MEHLVSGISLVMKRKDSRRVIIASAVFLFLLLFVMRDAESPLTAGSFIFASLGFLLGGINISLAYTHIRLQEESIAWKGTYPDLLRTLMKVGGELSGIAVLSVLLGFLGFSAMLALVPRQGEEIGYAGLIIVLIATCTLARKVAVPNVC
jgi:hypothetical protein